MEHLSQRTDVIRRYLLGDLANEELEDVELRVLKDNDYIDELDLVEEELTDDFVFGGLSDHENERIKKLFFPNAQRRELLQVAQALAQYINELFSVKDATNNGWEELLHEAYLNREKLAALSNDEWTGLQVLTLLRARPKTRSEIIGELQADMIKTSSVLDRLVELELIKDENFLLATEEGIKLLERLETATEIQFS